jgi:CheY-like chemotaxis protein
MMSVMPPCILYVEDDPLEVFFLEIAFKNVGLPHQLKVVPDGERALEYLSGSGPFADRELHPLPCLILLDIHLPRKNGLEVLEWIRQQPGFKSLPVVMFSNSSDVADTEKAHQLAADDYLIKPMPPCELDQLVEIIRDRWLVQPAAVRQECQNTAATINRPPSPGGA